MITFGHDFWKLRGAIRLLTIKSSFLDDVNGLRMHYYQVGEVGAPLVVLLHGFPELAYSWRKLIEPIANLGFYVVAPDQRGYGKTTGHTVGYDVDLAEFGMKNLTKDVAEFVGKLGYSKIELLVGHDFGSPVAAWTALMHSGLINRLVLMSAPFSGPPSKPDGRENDIHEALKLLSPPRKHYQKYFGERDAENNMINAPGGYKHFLRAYFHCKSAGWPGNNPFGLNGWTASELARMPLYYIMNDHEGMAETALSMAPNEDGGLSSGWISNEELAIYSSEFLRSGLQGGLNWYRRAQSIEEKQELSDYLGQSINIPVTFIAGEKDWGIYQVPGALKAMEKIACSNFQGTKLIEHAGHWVQQEKPKEVLAIIARMLASI